MGAWGVGIFSNDTAADIREEFRDLVADGMSASDATRRLQDEYGIGQDADHDCDFWLGLASAQHRLGHVDPDVIRRAIDIIDTDADLSRWSGPDVTRRRAVLKKLRATLETPARAPHKLRPRQRRETSLVPGQHIVVPVPEVGEVLLRIDSIHGDKGGRWPVALAVSWDGNERSLRRVDRLPPMVEPARGHLGPSSARAVEGEARGFVLVGREPLDIRVLPKEVSRKTPALKSSSRWVVPWSSLGEWFAGSETPSTPWSAEGGSSE